RRQPPERRGIISGKALLLPSKFAKPPRVWREELMIKRPSSWCVEWGIAAMGLLLSSVILAQETAGVAEVGRVIVTGSNIPSAEEVGPNPVFSLNRDLIDKSGQRTTADLLKIQPIANANSIPVQNNAAGQGGPTGAASVSLRGFDASATLVLIRSEE